MLPRTQGTFYGKAVNGTLLKEAIKKVQGINLRRKKSDFKRAL